MVAIFTGAGTGSERGSGSVLGNAGLLGSSNLGRDGEQVSLNAATGNLMISRQDEFLVGLGLDASVSRTYNSLGDVSDENGDNWRYSTDRKIENLTGTVNIAGSTVQRVSADGSVITYSWDSNKSAYVQTDGAGAYDTLTYDGANWTWTNGDSQVKESYSAYGSDWRIASRSDTDGNTLTFTYNAGQLSRVTTQDGSYLQYDWSGNNVSDIVTGYTDLATGTAKTLTRTSYAYDAQNRLQTVTVDLSPEDNSIADGKTYTTSYTYVGTTDLVASISQSDGSHIDITYDASNRVASIAETVSAGVTRTSTVTYGAGYTTITDPLGQVTRLDYDASDNLTKITMPPASAGAAAQVTQFAYDASGNVTSVTDALGNATTYSNFVNGLATTITDPLGNVTSRTYGSRNELLTETTTGSDAASSAGSHTTRYAYDAENHLRYKVTSEGHVCQYNYNASGELTSTTEFPGQNYDVSALAPDASLSEAQLDSWVAGIADKSSVQITQNSYDALGDLTSTTAYSSADSAGNPLTTDGTTTTTYTYDQAGKLLSRRVGGNNAETCVYDGLGRVVSCVDVNGGTTSYVFDDANSKTIVTLASGLTQTSTYNKAGELIAYTETPGYSELATNGTFASSTTGWTASANATLSVVSGRMHVTSVASSPNAFGWQLITVTPGVPLVLHADVLNGTGTASLNIGFGSPGNAEYGQLTAGLGQTFAFTPTSPNLYISGVLNVSAAGQTADFDNISVTTDAQSTAGYDELIVNGDGSTTAGWSAASHSTVTATGGRLRVTASDGAGVPEAWQAITTKPGATYRITLDAYAGSAQPRLDITSHGNGVDLSGPALLPASNISGHYEATFVADSTTTYIGLDTNDFTAGTYAEFDNISVKEQPVGTKTYGYDQDGRLRWNVDASGDKSYFIYDNAGRKTADVSGAGELTEYRYDADNRITETISYATMLSAAQLTSLGNENASADVATYRPASAAADRWTWHVYDNDGRLLQTIDADGSAVVNSYDDEGKLVQSTTYANKFPASVLSDFQTNPPTAVITSWSTFTPPPPPPAESTNQLPDLSNSVQWDESAGITQASTTAIATKPAWLYTLVRGISTALHIQGGISVAAGQTLTWTMTLKATANSQSAHAIGINTSGPFSSPSGVGTASIVSGPGSLAPDGSGGTFTTGTAVGPGLWSLSGLSQTQATTVRVSYTFSKAATVNLSVFLDSNGTSGGTATNPNDQIILSNPIVTTCSEIDSNFLPASSNLLSDLSDGTQWTETGATQAPASDADGLPAWSYTSGAGTFSTAAVASVQAQTAANAGDTVSWTMTALGTGGTATGTPDLTFGLADSAGADLGIMKIVSGPGILTHNASGTWTLSNYFSTVPTVIRITHSFTRATTAKLQVSFTSQNRQAASVILSNPVVTKTAASAITGFTTIHRLASVNDAISQDFYDEDGRLVGTLNPEGFLTQCIYDDAGQKTEGIAYSNVATVTSGTFNQILASVTADSANDRHTHYVYDGQGQLRFVVDGENFVTETKFDSSGQATSVTRYTNTLASTTADFTYDNMKALVAATGFPSSTKDRTDWSIYDAAGRIAYAIDGEGGVTGYKYNASGQVTKAIQFAAKRSTTTLPSLATMDSWATTNANSAGDSVTRNYYDGAGVLRYVVDGEGFVTRRAEDAEGRLLSVDRFQNPLSLTDSDTTSTVQSAVAASAGTAVTTNTTYDVDGRVSTTTDAAGSITRFAYNAFGNLVQTTDPLGNVSYNYYDALGRVTMSCDALNYVTETSYNSFGEVASVTRRYVAATNTPSATVAPTVTADPQDATTSFTYDLLGRLVKSTDALGNSEQYTLNAFGDRVSVVNKLNGTTTNVFDRRGLLLSETLPMSSFDKTGTQVAGTVTNSFTYDSRGNRTKMVEASGLAEQRTTNYVYDRADRLVTKTGDALTKVAFNDFTLTTGVTVTTTGSVVPTESYSYDTQGNVILATDANGAETFSYYDQLNRKIAEVSALGTLTTWTYDSAGNKLSQRVYGDFVALPGAAGGTPPNPVDASNYRETTYGYDALNRLKSTSVASVLVGTWNATNNGVSRSTVTVSSTLTYDANGNVITSTDANGIKTYSWYDDLNRKTDQLDGAGYLTHWTYDDEGNVLSEQRYSTKWTGAVSTTAPPAVAANANDRITNFTYDKNGRRLTETRTGVTAWVVSGTNGALTAAATSSTVTYTYNALGQVTSKTEATDEKVAYAYDKTGRLMTESRDAYTDQTGVSVTPTVHYYYNGLNNLTRTQQGGATLDNVNDRITTYTYGAGGRLASMTNPDGGVHNYDYDAAGNQVRDSYTRTKSDGTSVTEGILYRRDLLGRIVTQAIGTKSTTASWTRGDAQSTDYDAYGEISRRGINVGTLPTGTPWQETFVYNNRGLVEKSNTGDGVWRFHVYDKVGNEVLTIESEGNDYSATSLSTVLTALGANAGSTFVSGVNTTISLYDGRNQVTQVRQQQRETSGQGSPLSSIVTSQTYNGFGEVATQTDALNKVTTLTYNNMGRLISKVMPQVSVTSAAGVASNVTPTETYYYDLSGRQVGKKDADGNTISETLLDGTGYGGADAQVLKEFHPDSGVKQTQYDVFGDARTLTDELSRNETRTYDSMGRMLTDAHASGLTDHYTYDLLGQRIKHWDSAHGSTNVETTDYDLQGRVTSARDFAGDVTNTTYAWNGGLTNSGMSGTTAIGGWTTTTTEWAQLGSAAWQQKSETDDVHGLETSATDLGHNVTSFTYDRAGRLTNKSSGGTSLAYTYFNTGNVATVVDTGGTNYNTITSTYAYDLMGRRTLEEYAGTVYKSTGDSTYTTLTSGSQTLENATIAYDAMGRMTSFSSTGTTGTVTVTQKYDAAGNIRETNTSYPNLVAGTTASSDKWFTYDSMNRMVIANGALVSGAISGGTSLAYDAAGNRKTATTGTTVQTYNYDADNQLTTVLQNGSTIASTTRNALGQVTEYIEYLSTAPGGISNHRYNIVYNARGEVTSENDFQYLNGSTDMQSAITNQYDSYGNITRMDSVNTGAKDTWQSWVYGWRDSAVVSSSTFDKEALSSTNNLYSSSQSYDGLGRLQRASIADGRPREVDFALTSDGDVLSRVQNDGTSNDPAEYHLYASGVQVADYTNDNNEEVQNYDYQALITSKTNPGASGTGRFYQGTSAGTSGGEFGTSGYDPTNQITAGVGVNSRSAYTVQSGDTLQSIAQFEWGDASLWYLIANANGLSADAPLAAGQSLALPLKGPSNVNNASMYRPYDPQGAVGDLSPTSVKPPKGNKCGAFGQVLLTAIAVAVTVVTTPVLGPVGGAIAGDLASQGVGLLTGIQQGGFNFKEVALTAVTAGVDQGFQASGAFKALGIAGSSIEDAAARGVVSNVASQGIEVATGLQPKFSWAGVAAAGVGAGVGQAVGNFAAGQLHLDIQPNTNGTFQNPLDGAIYRGISGAVNAIANAATRSVINGSDFGDNVLAALPDVLGQTIGGAIADEIAQPSIPTPDSTAAAVANGGPTGGTISAADRAKIINAIPDAKDLIAAAARSDEIGAAARERLVQLDALLSQKNIRINILSSVDGGDAAANANYDGKNGIINIDAHSVLNSDHTVNLTFLAAELVHESTHLYDQMDNHLFADNLQDSRRTERNAFGNEADFLTAEHGTMTFLVDGRQTALTRGTYKTVAELSVKEDVKNLRAKIEPIRQQIEKANSIIDKDNATKIEYNRQVTAAGHPEMRLSLEAREPLPPLPVYRPPTDL